jgi:hypothetical protein
LKAPGLCTATLQVGLAPAHCPVQVQLQGPDPETPEAVPGAQDATGELAIQRELVSPQNAFILGLVPGQSPHVPIHDPPTQVPGEQEQSLGMVPGHVPPHPSGHVLPIQVPAEQAQFGVQTFIGAEQKEL